MKTLKHILDLGIKELLSLARDPVLLFLIAYCFTFSVYTPAKSAVMDVINASVAVVDGASERETGRIAREYPLHVALGAGAVGFLLGVTLRIGRSRRAI